MFGIGPMEMIIVAIIGTLMLLPWVACIWLGRYIARQKGRDELEGMLFGVFLGPLGLVIEALMPTLLAPEE